MKMEIKTGHTSISSLAYKIKNKKLLIPAYQRQYCWDDAKVELLIDSISKGIPIGVFQFRELPNGSLEVVDGLHRIRTLLNIMNGKGVYLDIENNRMTTNPKDFDYSPYYNSGELLMNDYCFNELEDKSVFPLERAKQTTHLRKKVYYTELLHFTFSGTDSEIQTAFDRINEKGVAFTPVFKPVQNSSFLTF